jgi:lambda family phage tail tape measure protein
MGKALEMSGGKAENLGTMLSKLAVNTQEARDGSDKLREAFKQVGITAAEVQNLNPEQLMERVAQQLSMIEDPITRNAKAIELLGKAAKGIDWNKYVDEYKRVADPDLASAIKDAGDAWDNIQKGVSSTYYFMVKLVQPFAAIVNYLATLKTQYDEFKNQGGAINFDPDNPMAEVVEFKGKGVASKPKEAPKPLLTGTNYQIASEKEKASAKRNEELAKRNQEMLAVAKLISGEYKRQQEFALQQLDTRIKMEGMTTNERKVQEAINQVLDSTSKKIDDITKKREDASRSDATAETLAEYDIQIAKVKEFSEVFVQATKAREEAGIAEQRTFAYGWNKAFAQYAEDAGNYGRLASDMFVSLTGNMNSALDNFVETGKLSFSDLASSIIKDLIKIQLRMQMMQLFSSLGGMLGGSFSSPTEVSAITSYVGPAFANGGNPPVGVPSLVGEKGPELFVPRSSGTIIPNNQLSSMMNTAPQTVYNGPVIQSMQAIDTQSGIQFLAKNKMTIWSMNQSANRSIPAGR